MKKHEQTLSKVLESLDREGLVYVAKVSEQAERYDDMAKAMKLVAESTEKDMTEDERNLLSVAYKNVVGARRSAWRIISSIEGKSDTELKRETAKDYRRKVEEELKEKCNDVLELIARHLEHEKNTEPKVFYQKMMGDYYRYLVEIEPLDSKEREETANKSKEAYELAKKESKDLPEIHPIRLGLSLNYSVFHYEIKGCPEEACKIAKEAFDSALAVLDDVDDITYKDSTLIMQLLRDNLTLWKPENEEGDEGEGGD